MKRSKRLHILLGVLAAGAVALVVISERRSSAAKAGE